LTLASLAVAAGCLVTVFKQRSEIRDLKRIVASKEKLDGLIDTLQADQDHKTGLIGQFPPEVQKAFEEYKPSVTPATLQQGIDTADLVLVTESRIKDNHVFQVVTRVIKLKVDAIAHVDLGHNVGTPEPIRKFTTTPEGAIVFCTGSPAEPKTFNYIYDGRVASYSGLPAQSAVRLIEEAAAKH
jgi:hypothetical protein